MLHSTLVQLLPPCNNSFLECVYHQRDSLFIRHPIELKNLFNSQHLIHKFFGWIPLEFWNIEYESTHLLIIISLHKVLMSMRSALNKRFSRSTPFVTTQVGYLGGKVFNLIPHSLELILLVLPTFSNIFAFCLRKSWHWLMMTTVRPTTHVPQANC